MFGADIESQMFALFHILVFLLIHPYPPKIVNLVVFLVPRSYFFDGAQLNFLGSQKFSKLPGSLGHTGLGSKIKNMKDETYLILRKID